MDCLLLGQDHSAYCEVTTVAVGDCAAASISVGADRQSPSLRHKGVEYVPNEDALCVVDTGELVFLAVADAHFGHESSHTLIETLYRAALSEIPRSAFELVAAVERFGEGSALETASESTLVVALFNRTTGRGTTVSFGDSTLAVVTAAGEYRSLNSKDERYVATGDAWPIHGGQLSEFRADTGDTLLMFTDGIDECHYRNPATSIQPRHIVGAVHQAGGEPRRTSELLAYMALAGVDGHPGGQDNVALIVVQA